MYIMEVKLCGHHGQVTSLIQGQHSETDDYSWPVQKHQLN